MCQNISGEVFLAAFKSSKNSLRRLRSGKGAVIHPASRKEGLWNIGHSMIMVLDIKKSDFGNQQCIRFHIWFIRRLYCKMRETFQNATAILLQNTIKIYYKMSQVFYCKMRHFITNCNSCYKVYQFYYKMQRLLQNASVHLSMFDIGINQHNVYIYIVGRLQHW